MAFGPLWNQICTIRNSFYWAAHGSIPAMSAGPECHGYGTD